MLGQTLLYPTKYRSQNFLLDHETRKLKLLQKQGKKKGHHTGWRGIFELNILFSCLHNLYLELRQSLVVVDTADIAASLVQSAVTPIEAAGLEADLI